MLTARAYASFHQEIAALGDVQIDSDRYSALTSMPQIFAYYFRALVQDDAKSSEEACDMIEIMVRSLDLLPHKVRDSAAVLKRLGFAELAERLREISGRRKNSLKPLAA